MDAVSLSSASRLLEALERASVSPGDGMVSSGPSPVPDSLKAAFERLMEQPGEASMADGFRSSGASLLQERSPADSSPSAQAERIDRPSLEDSAVSFKGEAPLLSPSDLYCLQFHVAMLRLQAEAGSQVTQKAAQGMDSLLRTQS